ncbi:hypothetical protein ABVM38_25520, partial [Klebsiella pneumoniae]
RAYCLKTQPATGETYPKSDLFNKAALWHQRYEVRGVENQIKHFNHPQLGRFSLQQMYWYSAPRNGSRLLVYLPMDEAGEQALAWLDQH